MKKIKWDNISSILFIIACIVGIVLMIKNEIKYKEPVNTDLMYKVNVVYGTDGSFETVICECEK